MNETSKPGPTPGRTTALGIMGCHALAYWYDACDNPGNWAFVRDRCPNDALASSARMSTRDTCVAAHRECALAVVLAWRDRVRDA